MNSLGAKDKGIERSRLIEVSCLMVLVGDATTTLLGGFTMTYPVFMMVFVLLNVFFPKLDTFSVVAVLIFADKMSTISGKVLDGCKSIKKRSNRRKKSKKEVSETVREQDVVIKMVGYAVIGMLFFPIVAAVAILVTMLRG